MTQAWSSITKRQAMKPRARWVRFVSWFVNTSPEWVAPEEREPPKRNEPPTAKEAEPGRSRPEGTKPDPSRR
jgi:hypothetical protein